MNAYRKRSNTIAWPPIIALTAVVLSLVAGFFFTPPFLQGPAYRSIGVLILIIVIAMDLWSILTLRRARTTVLPTRATTRLVTTGPFRLSRNPIYLGNVLLLVALALILANGWFILFALLTAFGVQKFSRDNNRTSLSINSPSSCGSFPSLAEAILLAGVFPTCKGRFLGCLTVVWLVVLVDNVGRVL